MRVLITSWAWPTHYTPMVPLAWALRASGHDVLVASSPSLAPTVSASGMPFMGIGADIDTAEWFRVLLRTPPAKPSTGAPRVPRAIRLFADLAEAMATDAVVFARQWRPDLVLSESSGYLGPLLARVLGVPAVRHPWGADILSAVAAMDGLADADRHALAPLCERFGVPPFSPREDLTVDICPAALQTPAAPPARLRSRYIPYNIYSAVPGWLAEAVRRRPRVCVTWGTTVGLLDPGLALLDRTVRALARSGVEVVVAVAAGQRSVLLPDPPPGVVVVESAPLQLLLPHCDAVIGHGGVGTLLTGLAAGLPQLVVAPLLPDHRFNGRQLVASAAGLALTSEEATPE
ncbi:MAG: nucleotide disphospho-sugar-binding domain-containing protein, partial [Pseudonocardiaceae bacterium]